MTDDALAALDAELEHKSRKWRCKMVPGARPPLWSLEPPAASTVFVDFEQPPVGDMELAMNTAMMLATAEATDSIIELCPRCSCDEFVIYPAVAQRLLIFVCKSCELQQRLSFQFVRTVEFKKKKDDQ